MADVPTLDAPDKRIDGMGRLTDNRADRSAGNPALTAGSAFVSAPDVSSARLVQTRTDIVEKGKVFAGAKEKIYAGELLMGAERPMHEIQLPGFVQKELAEFLIEYAEVTEQLKRQNAGFQPTPRDEVLRLFVEVLKKRMKEIEETEPAKPIIKRYKREVENAQKRNKPPPKPPPEYYDLYRDLFYEAREIVLGLSVMEEIPIQEKLLPDLNLAKQNPVILKLISSSIIEPSRMLQLRKSLLGALGIEPVESVIDNLEVAVNNRVIFNFSSQLGYYNEVGKRLRTLLTEVYKKDFNNLDSQEQIEVLLQAHEEAATAYFSDVCRSILSEEWTKGASEKTGEKARPLLEQSPAVNLARIIEQKRTNRPASQEEIDAKKVEHAKLAARKKQIEEQIPELAQIEASDGDQSLSLAKSSYETAKAVLEAKLKEYVQPQNNNQPLSDIYNNAITSLNERISGLETSIKQLESAKRDLENRQNSQIVVSGSSQLTPEEIAIKLREIDTALSEKRGELESYNRKKDQLTESNKARIEAWSKFERLEERRKILVRKLGKTPEERAANFKEAELATERLEAEVAALETGEPTPEDLRFVERAKKLRSIMYEDINEIFYRITTAAEGTRLEDLSGYDAQNGRYDIDKGTEAIVALLCRSYTTSSGERMVTRQVEEDLFPKLEIAYQLARYYGVESETIEALAQQRNKIREAAVGLDRLREERANATKIKTKQNELKEVILQQTRIGNETLDLNSLTERALAEVLPYLRIYGRWQAAEAISRIIWERAQDARDGYLFDAGSYLKPSKPKPTPPTAETSPPAPAAAPAGEVTAGGGEGGAPAPAGEVTAAEGGAPRSLDKLIEDAVNTLSQSLKVGREHRTYFTLLKLNEEFTTIIKSLLNVRTVEATFDSSSEVLTIKGTDIDINDPKISRLIGEKFNSVILKLRNGFNREGEACLILEEFTTTPPLGGVESSMISQFIKGEKINEVLKKAIFNLIRQKHPSLSLNPERFDCRFSIASPDELQLVISLT